MLLDDAARVIGAGPRALRHELRERGILDDKNIARRQWVQQGCFRVEARAYQLPGTRIQRHYAVTLVTGSGLSLLSEIAEQMRNEAQA
jgi:phage antirepressor YoqD-like protein